MRHSVLPLLLASLCACGSTETGGGSDAGGGGGARDGGNPAGSNCLLDSECAAGTYCGLSGKCTFDCTGNAQCATGYVCGARGRCESDGTVGVPDGGCPRVDVSVTPVIPTVVLLIDQSGSMTSSFGSTTRWNAVKNALTGTNGVLPALQSKVRFGATLYTNNENGAPCPDLRKEAPDMNNAGDIGTLLNNNPPSRGETPTGESLAIVKDDLLAMPNPVEGPAGPPLIVLATDGEPDTCANVATSDAARALSVTAARDAYALGVKTVVLSVGSDTAQSHLQDVANAGAGVAVGGQDAPYYVANDPAALVAAFNTIIGAARTCTFKLSGSLASGSESSGIVILNGTTLGYNDPNGWRMVDANTLELVGTACTTFKNSQSVNLSASFACGSVLQ